ncbi:hypothetical protein [Anaerobacillus sp. 1_MG-2023]|uniref:hypothetical protein n=1 Tax=Anaerobacillus sp. 1_MG-2023 TaxID=3062655 RepID=UPI0026E28EFA|nr:hypothetical protein [Anaerobacillus sp. 1_MG-2023]MDO6654735.1 hypothetical protein [Anaerobacillus sp. 1_MG-2023]
MSLIEKEERQFAMNLNLLVIGILLLIVFFVGALKQTWLLAGFNEKAIRDKG